MGQLQKPHNKQLMNLETGLYSKISNLGLALLTDQSIARSIQKKGSV